MSSAFASLCHAARLAAGGLLLLLAAGCAACDRGDGADGRGEAPGYETRASQNTGGTGRFYMGREIAQILGSDDLDRIERPGRETEELPSRVVRALDLQPSDVVADIGAGTGYFTFRLAPRVEHGQVFAVDIDPQMLGIIRDRMAETGITNVEPVRGTVTDPNLPPASVDVALIVFSYAQFSHPREMMQNIYAALKPGGRVVLVEYRGEDPTIPVEPVYKITQEQARKELEGVGYKFRENRPILPQQHFMVFEKPVG